MAERVYDERGVLRAERVTSHAWLGPEPAYLDPAASHAPRGVPSGAWERPWLATAIRMVCGLVVGCWLGVRLFGWLFEWLRGR